LNVSAKSKEEFLRNKDNEPCTLSAYCKINNAHMSGMVDSTTHVCPILSSPPTKAQQIHQKASSKHPQHKQCPDRNHAPQTTIRNHSLDAAHPIHQSNL